MVLDPPEYPAHTPACTPDTSPTRTTGQARNAASSPGQKPSRKEGNPQHYTRRNIRDTRRGRRLPATLTAPHIWDHVLMKIRVVIPVTLHLVPAVLTHVHGTEIPTMLADLRLDAHNSSEFGYKKGGPAPKQGPPN